MKIVHAALFAAGLAGLAALALTRTATATEQTSCERLSSLSLPNAAITLAESVPEGDFEFPWGGAVRTFSDLPSFCRVAVTLTPSADSDIHVEVWLPASNWNGKFHGGEGEGAIWEALRRGYVTSSVTTGPGPGGWESFYGNPEKLRDFAYRGVHEMTTTAKAIIEEFYGKPPGLSYFNGCSAEGGQGLMEAQRFPEDYDGVIAGAPGSPFSHGYSASRLWLAGAVFKDPSSAIPTSKISMIHDAVLRTCDARDGLTDSLIDDPRRCSFDPAVLVCEGADAESCLTVAQVETVRTLLSPVVNPRTGALIYPPLELGSELSWSGFAAGLREPPVDAFRILLNDPDWAWRTLDFDGDVARADAVIEAQETNTLDPDIRAFARRGGKLILYHGWSDATNAPQSTINYYNEVQSLLGDVVTSNAVRLFMGPGMSHCEGPNTFDPFDALERWVERAEAPDQIIASHSTDDSTDGRVDRTRPLCPYPRVSRYRGTGSIDVAANFECRMP